MRTASDPLRASRKRIAELWNLGNVDLDRPGRLVDPVVDRFLHARDVDSVIGVIDSKISRSAKYGSSLSDLEVGRHAGAAWRLPRRTGVKVDS